METETFWIEHRELNDPNFVPSDHLITSCRVVTGPVHDWVTIFNRGARAGRIVVDAGDGNALALRLVGQPTAYVWKEK